MVDLRPLPLAVGAVGPPVPGEGGSLVKGDAIVGQGFNEHLHRPGHFPLGVGILHPEEQHAAGLVGHALGDDTLHQVAQVDKAGGAGGHAGDNRPAGQGRGGYCSSRAWGVWLPGGTGVEPKQRDPLSITSDFFLFILAWLPGNVNAWRCRRQCPGPAVQWLAPAPAGC